MKSFKIGIFILTVAGLFTLGFVCGNSGGSDSGNPDKKDKQVTQQDKQEKTTPGKIDYKITNKEIKDSSTKKNYEIDITYPQIEGLNNGAQEKFNSYIETLMKAQADSFTFQMKDWKGKSELGSEYDITDTVEFMTANIISVSFDGYADFAGTAHPSHFSISVNYDLKNSKVLKLSDLFTGNYTEIISQNCISEIIRQQREANGSNEGIDTTWVKTGAGPKEKNFQVFNITHDTLFITFPEYTVASYAEGDYVVAIPYTKLKGNINPSGPLSEFVK